MKKMTYLMMLVLGLTAVNSTQALTLKDRLNNTKEAFDNAKHAKGIKNKMKSLAKSTVEAAERNKHIIEKAVMA
jgi:hypothetical protein